jgi:hypothetical protein
MAAKTPSNAPLQERSFSMEHGNAKPMSPPEKLNVNNWENPILIGMERATPKKTQWSIRRKIQLSGLGYAAICGALIWGFGDCLGSSDVRNDLSVSSSKAFRLVKDAIQVTLAAPVTSVLECFQVYQPVLLPAGAVDQTASGDGSENTTVIIPIKSNSSCQVLLMDHSFGYSYGMPFVGE